MPKQSIQNFAAAWLLRPLNSSLRMQQQDASPLPPPGEKSRSCNYVVPNDSRKKSRFTRHELENDIICRWRVQQDVREESRTTTSHCIFKNEVFMIQYRTQAWHLIAAKTIQVRDNNLTNLWVSQLTTLARNSIKKRGGWPELSYLVSRAL